MSLTTSKTVLVLWVTVAFAAISLCASMRQDGKTSYSLEGAWLCQATFPGGLPPWGADTVFLYMDTYTSNSANPGRSGTVLCTLHPWKFGPGLSLNSTESGQGSWIRIGKNQFAVTVRRIMVNADGMAVGTVKFRGIITLITENEFSGTLSAVSYDVDGNQIGPPTPTGNSIGKRIEVETE